jgi:CheY-like chemotaxis protein
MSKVQQSALQILIVEDEPLVRMVARATLEDAGFDPVEAATADEALRLLAGAHDFAAVVSDIEMPGEMNGLELAWAIRAQWPKIGVVLTSGRKLPRPVDMPLKVRFMAKPYHPAHLVQIVTEATS